MKSLLWKWRGDFDLRRTTELVAAAGNMESSSFDFMEMRDVSMFEDSAEATGVVIDSYFYSFSESSNTSFLTGEKSQEDIDNRWMGVPQIVLSSNTPEFTSFTVAV